MNKQLLFEYNVKITPIRFTIHTTTQKVGRWYLKKWSVGHIFIEIVLLLTLNELQILIPPPPHPNNIYVCLISICYIYYIPAVWNPLFRFMFEVLQHHDSTFTFMTYRWLNLLNIAFGFKVIAVPTKKEAF